MRISGEVSVETESEERMENKEVLYNKQLDGRSRRCSEVAEIAK
jgi:hypothetical protein